MKLDAAASLRVALCQPESMQSHNRGHQAEAKARPGRAAASIPALEPAQELGKVRRRNAWAGIGDADGGSPGLVLE